MSAIVAASAGAAARRKRGVPSASATASFSTVFTSTPTAIA